MFDINAFLDDLLAESFPEEFPIEPLDAGVLRTLARRIA